MRKAFIVIGAAALCVGIQWVVPVRTESVSQGEEARPTLSLLYTVNNVGYLSPCG